MPVASVRCNRFVYRLLGGLSLALLWNPCYLFALGPLITSRADVLRHAFLSSSVAIAGAGGSIPNFQSKWTVSSRVYKQSYQLPLVFLPTAGCLAISISLDPTFSYYAIIDTGSPFLTAPPGAQDYTVEKTDGSTSLEQYGAAIGDMMWRSTRQVTLYDVRGRPVRPKKETDLGIPAANVMDEAGGVYFGLLGEDSIRPSVLQQWGIQSFCLDYPERTLTLQSARLSASNQDHVHELYDFSAFGSNVHHYGVLCNELNLLLKDGGGVFRTVSSLDRPVVVVLDSGLTGCIVSESLEKELSLPLDKVSGVQVSFGDTVLTSSPKYWSLSSIRLPWFDLDQNHPHIVAVGGTFLRNSKLTVDLDTRLVQVLLGEEERTW